MCCLSSEPFTEVAKEVNRCFIGYVDDVSLLAGCFFFSKLSNIFSFYSYKKAMNGSVH